MIDNLIYGKSNIQNIINLEVTEDKVEIYTQDQAGEVSTQFLPNKFWILCNERVRPDWVKLKGNLHYQYGKQFTNRQEFSKARHFLKQTHDIFNIWNEQESCMVKDGFTYYKGLSPKDIPILSFDLETTGLDPNRSDAAVLLISNTFRKNGIITKKLFAYDDYTSEADMIIAWTAWVREMNPSIITNHNVNGFDIPYINTIASKYGISLDLGRDSSSIQISNYESKFRVDGAKDLHFKRIKCYGREIVDTMFLALKSDIGEKKYESYGLKKIIAAEGLEKKGRIFYDASQIRHNYKNPIEWAKIKEYCKDDADDALALFDLFIPPFFYLAQSVPKSFQIITESATGSQINSMMIRSYLQEGHSLPKADLSNEYEGAISFGNPGIYSNAIKVDVKSMYPSIMIEHKVCNHAKDPNKHFPAMVQYFTSERLKNKELEKKTGKRYYKDLEQSQKIVINSMYGFLSTNGLAFNYPQGAALVTEKGRDILKRAIMWAENKKFNIINADTDSITYSVGRETTEAERKQQLLELNSLFPSTIIFDADGYFPKFIVLMAKNYIMFDGKKIKYKGSSLKSSTLEPALKEFMKDIIDALLNDKTNYTEIYHKYVKEIDNITDIKRWASKKTITDKTLKAPGTTQVKMRKALEGTEYVEGDKPFMYFKSDDSLAIIEHFDGDYHKDRFYEKLYDCTDRFSQILNLDDHFLNYKLKRNKKALAELLSQDETKTQIVQVMFDNSVINC